MVRRHGADDKPGSKNPLLAALDCLLAEAARYPAYPLDADLARLHSHYVGVELAAHSAGVAIPPFCREAWPLYVSFPHIVSVDGGQTWEPSQYYQTLQVGDFSARQQFIAELRGIALAVRRQSEANDAPSTGKPSRKCQQRETKPQSPPPATECKPPRLNPTDKKILKALPGKKVKPGYKISREVGRDYEYVRHRLARLVNIGLLQKTGDGYGKIKD
jgi:hypothetical protein